MQVLFSNNEHYFFFLEFAYTDCNLKLLIVLLNSNGACSEAYSGRVVWEEYGKDKIFQVLIELPTFKNGPKW